MQEKQEETQQNCARGSCSKGFKTMCGGQALIEGIMIRGKYNWSVAVREPAGEIYVEEHDLNSGKDKNGWMYWPLVRGCRALVESLMLGFKALEIAALHAFGGEEGEQQAAAEEKELERERRRHQAMLAIKKKFGKNAIIKGMDLQEGATAMERNAQIGGHKA